jgi:hypothetical protein
MYMSCAAVNVFAQAPASGTSIAAKLQSAGVIDAYFPEVVLEVATALTKAAPEQWRGVQVNQAHRAGWLNIYTIDARRLPDDGLLDNEGVPNFTPITCVAVRSHTKIPVQFFLTLRCPSGSPQQRR